MLCTLYVQEARTVTVSCFRQKRLLNALNVHFTLCKPCIKLEKVDPDCLIISCGLEKVTWQIYPVELQTQSIGLSITCQTKNILQ